MSAPPPDTKNSDDDLLELADLIEDEADISSGGSSDDMDEEGVDTSFEQELEDLFAEDLGLPDDDSSDEDDGGADDFDSLLADDLASEDGADSSDDDDDLMVLDDIVEAVDDDSDEDDGDDDDLLLLDDIVAEADDTPDMDLDAPETDEAGGDDGDMDLDGLDDLIDDLQGGSDDDDDDDILSLDDLGAEVVDDDGSDDPLGADDLMADLDGLDEAGGGDDDEDILLLDEVVEDEVGGVMDEVEAVAEDEPAPETAPEPAAKAEDLPEPDADDLEDFLMSGSGKGISYEQEQKAEPAPEPAPEPTPEPAPESEAVAEEDDLAGLDELMADVDDVELEPDLDLPDDDIDTDTEAGDDTGDDLDALLDEAEDTLAETTAEDVDDVLDSLPAAHDLDVDALLSQEEGGTETLDLEEIDTFGEDSDDLLGMADTASSGLMEGAVEGLDTLEDVKAQILVMEEAAGNTRDLLDDLESRVASLEAAGADAEAGSGDSSDTQAAVESLFESGSPLMARIKDEILGEVMEKVDDELAGRFEAGAEDLKQDILEHITADLEKLVPAAAARVIREEIAALSEDMDD